MAKDIKIVQVSFNLLDPEQKYWHEFVYGKPNSSGYIKRLIQRDMEGSSITIQLPEVKRSEEFSVEGWI
ncbi:hypothetical protein [Paenibacillus sp. Marseille-Q4541]|uniref:hypothetical protein n=1 Tax=Paenibacillus sp. Marseille-Q4541 TaxID=2831522 RepID=UPI001BA9B129|nr:hypothetical protein [Paenibacillus sp. Marseille-Q4541]